MRDANCLPTTHPPLAQVPWAVPATDGDSLWYQPTANQGTTTNQLLESQWAPACDRDRDRENTRTDHSACRGSSIAGLRAARKVITGPAKVGAWCLTAPASPARKNR